MPSVPGARWTLKQVQGDGHLQVRSAPRRERVI